MANFQGRAQINYTRRSSLSDGWYSSASGAYAKESERIPPVAWVWVAAFAALAYLVLHIGAVVGF